MPEPLPGSVHDPASGEVIPASWGDAVNAYAEDQDTGPSCRVYHSANQSVPQSTWTTLSFNSEYHDTEDLHDNAVSNSRLTVPAGKGGTYIVVFQGKFTNTGTNNELGARIRLNGGPGIVAHHAIRAAGYRHVQVVSPPIALSAGDYVEAQVYQDYETTGTLEESVSEASPRFGMVRQGPSA